MLLLTITAPIFAYPTPKPLDIQTISGEIPLSSNQKKQPSRPIDVAISSIIVITPDSLHICTK